jgi:hypothetical protein
MWWTVMAGILIVPALAGACYLVPRLETKKDRITAILSVLFPSLGLILQTFKPTQLPPDYVSLHQPWLEADLIVSDLREATFRLSYEIRNIGKLPAEKLQLFDVSPISRAIDRGIIFPKHLAPGASIIHEPTALAWESHRLPPVPRFTLGINYSAQVGETRRDFRAVFGNHLRIKELKEGRYKPVALIQEEGAFSDEELTQLFSGGFFAFPSR